GHVRSRRPVLAPAHRPGVGVPGQVHLARPRPGAAADPAGARAAPRARGPERV
ncbi:MAG: hypothetical protein AVDCRST_MAG07-1804, partial [uncultured Frankineae bacterium]